jgi:peroxiredoxin
VVDVRKDYERFRDAGGELVVVTMGNVEETDQFRRSFDAAFTFLSDTEQTAYRAYGLARGTLRQIAGPSVWLPALKALARGGAGKPVGDIRQMPGSFVIDREGIIRHAHYPTHQADRSRPEDVVRVLQGLAKR